ncbi:MAG TPA: hypothetical protein VND19_15590 [Acetobacteraceae bacterium]|nr:hypothetical protein [Acetobacteraceae bacterium]
MTPKFLHEQATYLRGIAGVTDLRTSKVTLLTLAEDYEALAKAAEKLNAEEMQGCSTLSTEAQLGQGIESGESGNAHYPAVTPTVIPGSVAAGSPRRSRTLVRPSWEVHQPTAATVRAEAKDLGAPARIVTTTVPRGWSARFGGIEFVAGAGESMRTLADPTCCTAPGFIRDYQN